MISRKMEKALNGQVNKEMYSAYLYMAMSSYCNLIGLKGFANWFMVQYHEEMLHAMKIYEYIGKLRLVGAGPEGSNGLSMIDKELGARITTVPTDYSKGIEAAMKGTAAVSCPINTPTCSLAVNGTIHCQRAVGG